MIEKKRVTKKDRVRSWLMRGKSLTQMQAVRKFRCLRLSAVIYELRNGEGIPIIAEYPEADRCRTYAVYRIDPEWLRQRRKSFLDWLREIFGGWEGFI